MSLWEKMGSIISNSVVGTAGFCSNVFNRLWTGAFGKAGGSVLDRIDFDKDTRTEKETGK